MTNIHRVIIYQYSRLPATHRPMVFPETIHLAAIRFVIVHMTAHNDVHLSGFRSAKCFDWILSVSTLHFQTSYTSAYKLFYPSDLDNFSKAG